MRRWPASGYVSVSIDQQAESDLIEGLPRRCGNAVAIGAAPTAIRTSLVLEDMVHAESSKGAFLINPLDTHVT